MQEHYIELNGSKIKAYLEGFEAREGRPITAVEFIGQFFPPSIYLSLLFNSLGNMAYLLFSTYVTLVCWNYGMIEIIQGIHKSTYMQMLMLNGFAYMVYSWTTFKIHFKFKKN